MQIFGVSFSLSITFLTVSKTLTILQSTSNNGSVRVGFMGFRVELGKKITRRQHSVRSIAWRN